MEKNNMQASLEKFYQDLNQILLPENAVSLAALPDAAAAAREDAGVLINRYAPQVKTDVFFDVLRQVAKAIEKHYPQTVGEVSQIMSALPVEPAAQALLVTKAFIPGTNLLAVLQQDLPADTIGLLFNHTVKLFMKQYVAQALPYCDLELWQQGRCPVCGSRPSLAVLDKETGKRYLYCGLCEIKWRFQRLGCPYCLNKESQFITVEGMEKYRLYVCESCRGYIKTVDGKRMGDAEVNLFLEDINTLQLDLLAMSEGYFNNPENNIPGEDF